MSKRIMQTKKAKEEFYSPILSLLKTTRTSEEIAGILCISERKARDEINTTRKHYAVISGSFTKGYRLARKFTTMSLEEKIKEKEMAVRTVNEFQSRIADMKKNQKPLIAYIKSLEKAIDKEILNQKDNQNDLICSMQNKK